MYETLMDEKRSYHIKATNPFYHETDRPLMVLKRRLKITRSGHSSLLMVMTKKAN